MRNIKNSLTGVLDDIEDIITDPLTRTADTSLLIKAEDINEDGSFVGYGSTFGGKKDSYGDIIAEGAFKESLKQGGRNRNGIIPMLYQHRRDKVIGHYSELVENKSGLKVKGQLLLQLVDGSPYQDAVMAYTLLKQGIINGLSIGFDLLRDDDGKVVDGAVEFNKRRNAYILKQIELWEISIVTFPANVNATVNKVKSAIEQANTPRELEHALKGAGLTNSTAKYIVSLCKDGLRDESQEEYTNELNNILICLREANAEIEEAGMHEILASLQQL